MNARPGPGSATFVAVIGDMQGSRALGPADRRQAQRRLEELVTSLDEQTAATRAAGWIVTAGDEFQGLLHRSDDLIDVLWEIERAFVARPRIRVGVGRGPLITDLQPRAIGMDGPAFHRARSAIERSKREARGATVFEGFGEEADRVLCGVARALHVGLAGLTGRQREVLAALRAGRTQAEAARDLGITRQSLQQHVRAMGWPALQGLDDALRAALDWVEG